MQISLKGLLAIVAFFGGLFWCAAWVGFDNGIFWFVFVVSAIMSLLFVAVARTGGYRAAWLIPLGGVGFCILLATGLASLALFANAVLLLIAAIVCAFFARPLRTKTLLACAAACMLAAFAIGTLPGISEMERFRAIQAKYPIVPLSNRLKYEVRHEEDNPKNVQFTPVVLSNLSAEEKNFDSDSLIVHQLKSLHDGRSEAFARALGFGVGRMMIFEEPRDIDQPPVQDIPFNATLDENFGTRYGNRRSYWEGNASNRIEQLYDAVQRDFVDPSSLGAVLEPKQAAIGFVPHALHYPPTASLKDPSLWTIEKLELVSLLKFDGPRIYVLDHLPRMDQLSSESVPTRPLDEFETAALAQLRAEKDVVVDHQGNQYRMLGSLRAAKQCMDCHTVERGELLGAFSYKLHSNLMAEAK
jgi:hypothetical protein